jgi:hypothetical protein
MNETELQQNIALYYSKLPPKAQEIFSSMLWLETLKEISSEYNLTDEQKATLGTETTLALLGITHISEYEQKIAKELALSKENTESMSREIEEKIFKSIRPELIQTYNTNAQTVENEEIEQKLDKDIDLLPEEIEKIIKESNYQSKVYSIARAYNLNIEQMGALESNVTDLIMGRIAPEDFEKLLEKNLEMPIEKVGDIVNEINEKIFKVIRGNVIALSAKKYEEKNTILAPSEIIPNPIINHEDNNILDLDEHKDFVIPIKTTPQTQTIQEEKLEITGSVQSTPILPKKEIKIEEIGEIEIPKIPETPKKNPVFIQKLSSSFQNPIIKTNHTLENITRVAPINTEKPIINSTPSTYPPKADPYREIPE